MKKIFKQWAIIAVFLCIAGCQRSCVDCTVHVRQTVDGLANNQSIIVYDQDCTANSPTNTNIAFRRSGLNIKRERGDIFRAKGVDSIGVSVLSKDSVKVVYKQVDSSIDRLDISIKQEHIGGITFIYEDKSNPRFSTP